MWLKISNKINSTSKDKTVCNVRKSRKSKPQEHPHQLHPKPHDTHLKIEPIEAKSASSVASGVRAVDYSSSLPQLWGTNWRHHGWRWAPQAWCPPATHNQWCSCTPCIHFRVYWATENSWALPAPIVGARCCGLMHRQAVLVWESAYCSICMTA